MHIKTILLILIVALSTACSEKIPPYQWEQAIEMCKKNGGVDYIRVYTNASNYLFCINGLGKSVKKPISK